jgi:hypothetical protein
MEKTECIKNLPFEKKIQLLDEADKVFVLGYIEALSDIHKRDESQGTAASSPG